jgi:hypothetical protein
VSRAPEHALLRDERGPVGIRPADRTAGLGLVGGQGTGKTAAICRTVASDARDPDCVLIVLDPKSDLADKALSVIPPERIVHYLDFEAPEIGINPLLAPGDPAMVADKVVEAFKDIHEDGDIRASSDRFLRQAAHAAIGASRLGAIEEEPNLWHMYRLLLPSEEEFRDRIVRAIEPKPSFVETAVFFGRDLPDDLRAAPALTTGKLDAPRNKILRLLVESLDKVLRHPIQLSLDEIIRRREALVVDGRMGTFGAGNCRVMMQFILALVYGALQRQQQLPERERARVALKVDEAHLILNESFANALATLALGRARSGGRLAVRRADPGPQDPRRDAEPAAPALRLLARRGGRRARARGRGHGPLHGRHPRRPRGARQRPLRAGHAVQPAEPPRRLLLAQRRRARAGVRRQDLPPTRRARADRAPPTCPARARRRRAGRARSPVRGHRAARPRAANRQADAEAGGGRRDRRSGFGGRAGGEGSERLGRRPDSHAARWGRVRRERGAAMAGATPRRARPAGSRRARRRPARKHTRCSRARHVHGARRARGPHRPRLGPQAASGTRPDTRAFPRAARGARRAP